MNSYGYNATYLIKNGKPWFPIMGEIHFSRVPKEEWRDYLLKMKAGGVTVVSSYCIWIHHEEIEGRYDFEGNKNVGEFVKVCQECGLELILRVGPWCHGEVRNGGFPDWLLQKPFQLRENNEEYFSTIRQYYGKLYEQVDGLLLGQGGPIIGLQIENEYGHCGGLTGEAGEEHMRRLTKLAKEVGFEVPLYTATGWGGAVTGGLIPVMGGYCDAPWDARITEIEPSGNYVFSHERNDQNIGSDYGIGHGITFDMNAFPFLTAELGGGLQVTKHRRPRVSGSDIGAMSLVKLGSGVNLLGYYMYCGGTNPKGILTSLQETKATGYANDLPELSYDFQAAVGEYGQISDVYKEIKLLSMFIKDFGEELCNLPSVIPADNPNTPADFLNLRYTYRHDGSKGYVFINNYQRRRVMAEHKDVELTVELLNETITFSKFDVADGDYFFYPINMKIGEAVLKKAFATPLCILNGKSYVFYTDTEPNYELAGELGDNELITISREEARNAWKVTLDKEYLVIGDCVVLQKDEGLELISKGKVSVKIYPELESAPEGFLKTGKSGMFTTYEAGEDIEASQAEFNLIKESDNSVSYEIGIQYTGKADNYFLRLDYEGESARLYADDELVADHFYYGEEWKIGLKRLGLPKMLRLEIAKLSKETPVYLEKSPELGAEGVKRLKAAVIENEVRRRLEI
ncbi:beta-galactosidase [Konateibacter massiliensis]|uniref:beta-galactosidase n=1 Tax=Konateibacter massiliensis TaxID=2002841 RepID=UPI000C15077B|nr:beta-galactosidase [Konateibacter massiliensis]